MTEVMENEIATVDQKQIGSLALLTLPEIIQLIRAGKIPHLSITY